MGTKLLAGDGPRKDFGHTGAILPKSVAERKRFLTSGGRKQFVALKSHRAALNRSARDTRSSRPSTLRVSRLASRDGGVLENLVRMQDLGERGIGGGPGFEKGFIAVARAGRIPGKFANARQTVECEAGVGPLLERILVGGFGAGIILGADESNGLVFADGTDIERRLRTA